MAKKEIVKKPADEKPVAAAETAAPVDINQMHVSVLIIARKKETFNNTANYLNRRGWKTLVISDIMNAFKEIGTFKPDFVMLSVNMNSPKIAQLPSILFTTFKVPVIKFCEQGDAKTQRLFHDIKSNYAMQGQLSGPGVHRRIKTILQEIHKVDDGSEGQKGLAKSRSSEETVRIATDKDGKGEKTYTMVSGGADGGNVNSGSWSGGQNGESYNVTGGGADENDAAYIASGVGSEGSQMITSEDYAKNLSPEELAKRQAEMENARLEFERLMNEANAENAAGGSNTSDSFGTNGSDWKPNENGAHDSSNWSETSNSQQSGGGGNAPGANVTNTASAGQVVGNTDAKTLGSTAALEEVKNLNGQFANGLGGAPGSVVAPESEASALEALIIYSAKAAALAAKEPVKKLGVAERCTFWPVQYAKFSGLVMVAHGGSLSEEDAFNALFLDYLKAQAKMSPHRLEVYEYIATALEQVDLFEQIKGQVFERTFKSSRNEILLKLIEVKPVVAKLTDKKLQGRLEITSSNLFDDLCAGVNLQMHMPMNERFFTYLKSTSILSAKQRAKLQNSKTSLYLNPEELKQFQTTYSRNVVVQMIRDMKKPKQNAA